MHNVNFGDIGYIADGPKKLSYASITYNNNNSDELGHIIQVLSDKLVTLPKNTDENCL